MWDEVVDVFHRIGGEEKEVEGNVILMPCERGRGCGSRVAKSETDLLGAKDPV